MADPKIAVGMAIGDRFLAFKAPKNLYNDLAATLGLTVIDTPAELGKALFLPAANAGFNRVRVSYEKTDAPAGTSKSRSGNLWCNPDKWEEVTGAAGTSTLVGKTYRSYPITKVGQPLDSNRY